MGICGSSKQSTKKDDTNAQSYYRSIKFNELNTQPKEKIQMQIQLKNCDSAYSYNVSLILYDNKHKTTYKDGGTTETESPIDGTINFKQFFICEYYFEKEQPLVFNIRKNTEEISVETKVGYIMGQRGQLFTQKLSSGEILEIRGKSLDNSNLKMRFNVQLSGYLQKKQFCYVVRYLGLQSEPQNTILYKSEQKEGISDIYFDETSIPIIVMSNQGKYEDSLISIEIHDLSRSTIIGEKIGTVSSFMNRTTNPKMKVGDIDASIKTNIYQEYTFLDYLRGGMQIALVIAIDFTASNKNPLDKNSLHNITEKQMNPYERAIRACGDIVAYYDYDQLFPVYGYGAIIPNESQVNHCFPLTLTQDPNIKTIDGVLAQYRNVLPALRLYGPTYFSPIINSLIAEIKEELKSGDSNQYYILMILTDGQITDMNQTIDAIVEASFLPISLIIIGIGYENFENMVVLDADDNPLFDTNGRKAVRDLVQFVPFYQFQNDGEKLAEEVLEEIPRQVVEYYYKLNKKVPNDPIYNIAGQ